MSGGLASLLDTHLLGGRGNGFIIIIIIIINYYYYYYYYFNIVERTTSSVREGLERGVWPGS